MKTWVKRSIVITTIGVFIALPSLLRPALIPDRCLLTTVSASTSLPNGGEGCPRLELDYTINLANPAGQTRFIGDLEPNAFNLLRDDSTWKLHIAFKDGSLLVENNASTLHAANSLSNVRFVTLFEISSADPEKQPDGSYHPIYYLQLNCVALVTPSFLGKPVKTCAVQTLKVDPLAGSIDSVEPVVSLENVIGEPTVLHVKYPVKGLPSRFTGTPAEKALQFVLVNLGRVDSRETALQAAEALPAHAGKMLTRSTDADKPWPECWGADAPVAESCSRQIVPTLIYLQENDCFGVQKLADFINSPTFARFFGESFADKATAPLEDAPMDTSFPIEKVDDLDIEE